MVATAKRQVEAYAPLRAETVSSADSNAVRSLKGIATPGIVDRATCYVVENENLYRWFEESTLAESLPSIVRPDDIDPADPGRWIIAGTGGGGDPVVVESEADFPAPVGGVITLADDTCYLIRGTVTIADDIQIQFGSQSFLMGDDPLCSTLIGNTTGTPFLLATLPNVLGISELTVQNNGTGAVAEVNGTSATLRDATLDGQGNGPAMVLDGALAVTLIDSAANNSTIGIHFTNAASGSLLMEGGVIGSTTGVQVDADVTDISIDGVTFAGATDSIVLAAAATVTNFSILSCQFGSSAPTTVFDIDGSITQLIFNDNDVNVPVGTGIDVDGGASVSAAIVSSNLFRPATGNFVDGADFSTPNWEFVGNIGVQNSSAVGGMHITSSVVVGASGVLSADAGVQAALALDGGSSQFQLGSAGDLGKLEYLGLKNVQATVKAVISASLGAAADVTFQIFRNGLAVNVPTTVRIGTNPTIAVVEAIVPLVNGDVLDVNVDTAVTLANYSLTAVAAGAPGPRIIPPS